VPARPGNHEHAPDWQCPGRGGNGPGTDQTGVSRRRKAKARILSASSRLQQKKQTTVIKPILVALVLVAVYVKQRKVGAITTTFFPKYNNLMTFKSQTFSSLIVDGKKI